MNREKREGTCPMLLEVATENRKGLPLLFISHSHIYRNYQLRMAGAAGHVSRPVARWPIAIKRQLKIFRICMRL
jgi:hypothetical protein